MKFRTSFNYIIFFGTKQFIAQVLRIFLFKHILVACEALNVAPGWAAGQWLGTKCALFQRLILIFESWRTDPSMVELHFLQEFTCEGQFTRGTDRVLHGAFSFDES